jgi:Protein of unknown function (DUF1592)/Protein of unknown function (DUF1588)/Protein of unknown function (DUF1587)/Protein of unknown function (DUF1585)/Protein of unknown function (DUF1595)
LDKVIPISINEIAVCGGRMLRAVRITISLLVLGAGAIPWLSAASRIDANLAETSSSMPGAETFTVQSKSIEADLARRFNQTVRPFVTTYCTGCHSGPTPTASFDLHHYTTMQSVIDDFPHWALVLQKLTMKEMPPQEMKQPPEELRRQVIDWITAVRKHEARKNAGDPGPVLARRLSNAEYNYTIRDLTGVDLRPAREFPIDPANQAGFDNSGESLTISPALMTKYLEAAREVADHLVLKLDGFSFAPHPMLVETDRDKYSVKRIVDFYDRQPTDFAQYFEAAWRYKNRVALRQPSATLASIAAQTRISPRYLITIWNALEKSKEEVGPLARLQAMWRSLPVPRGNQADLAHEACLRMRDFVVKIRRHTEKLFTNVVAPGISANFQPLVMYRNRLLAAHRRDFDPSALRIEGEPPPQNFVVTLGPTFGKGEAEELKKAVADYIKERQEDADLIVPAGERTRYEAAFARFSSLFPTAFCLQEHGRFYPITSMDKGRYLGAGFHNVMGYFRDDTPLIALILDEKGKKELDTLWDEFDLIADYTVRTYYQFIYNAGEGGGIRRNVERPSQNEFTTEAAIFKLRDQILAKTATDTDPAILEALKDYFDRTNTQIRMVERTRMETEPRHLDALIKFASRAYRRPLAPEESEEIFAYYRELREQKGLRHEEAMRGSIASILTSPEFLYRVDLVNPSLGVSARSASLPAATQYRPLSGYSLASRLSYFLWSSMPDEELLTHAAAGDLNKPSVLVAQVRRMLKDSRARAMATEFGGNWLDFRRFESHNAVDRGRFPSFTNELREAMFEEPIRFITDMIQNDRSVLDLLYGNYTFVNRTLAQHYGMPVSPGSQDEWLRVNDARAFGRGGLLPMAVFLTQNAPGLRTSPVKRGYWVARRALGEVIPPPPPAVPELPRDESKSDLPVRELLAKHRENKLCASCHARFDSFGVAFEGYGPIGERRTKDLAGRPVDVDATFPGGGQGAGIDGLLAYIRTHREKDFLYNLSEKLLAYGLGRTPMLSDEPLLEMMQAKLAASGYKMSALTETIVTSPQFLNRRSPEFSLQSQRKITQQKGGN